MIRTAGQQDLNLPQAIDSIQGDSDKQARGAVTNRATARRDSDKRVNRDAMFDEVVKAFQPFKRAADNCDAAGFSVDMRLDGSGITVGDLRRARAALDSIAKATETKQTEAVKS